AIQCYAQLTVRVAQAIDEVLKVLAVAGVRQMIGKLAIWVAEQFGNFAAKFAQYGRKHGACHAIAAIHGNAHWSGKLDVSCNTVDIVSIQTDLSARARLDSLRANRLIH